MPGVASIPGVAAGADADYRVAKLLGEGGMGAVYAARQQSMDRPVAIKVLKSRAARLESGQRAFVSEAIITGGLDHPNIVPIYDVGKQADDSPFYAMKQVEGVEWRDRLPENSLTENLDILLRVSDAIAFGHARRIIHRDLKPENIMLGAFGEVLVMDWGLAMPTQDHPRRASFPRARRGGTPHYMAPEMAAGVQDVDRRSDVYLLGAILFEIVTGKAAHVLDSPPENRRDHVKACLVAVAQNVIASTDESGELVEIARKAMATDRADRYQTVPEFQAAIREYLAHEESIELAARAADRLDDARQSKMYDEFSRARFGFEAALEGWPDNVRAAGGLKETRHDYASTAFDRGDFDLALSLLDEADSDELPLRSSIQQAIVERNARQQHIRRLRRLSFATSLAVALVASVAAVWINSERSKTETRRLNAVAAEKEEATQRGIADNARALAETRADEARVASVVARTQTSLALDTLNVVIFEIQRGLENVLGASKVRRKLLNTALARLQQIADEFAETGTADFQTMAASIELANVFLRVGQGDGVDDAAHSSPLIAAYDLYKRANEIGKTLAATNPTHVATQINLSVSYQKLGEVSLMMGQVSEALAFYHQSLDIGKSVASANPTDAQAQRDLRLLYDRLGKVSLQMGQVTEALAFYQQSVDIRKSLAAVDPTDAQAQRYLIFSHVNVGETHRQLLDYPASIASYQAGLKVAAAVQKRGLLKDSVEPLIQALDQKMTTSRIQQVATGDWETVLKQAMKSPVLLYHRAAVFAKRKKFDEAAQAAAKYQEIAQAATEGQADQLYNAARAYGLCAAAVQPAEGETLTEEQQTRREGFLDLSLACLKEAIAAGYDNFERARKDSDLAALRELPEFQKLIKFQPEE